MANEERPDAEMAEEHDDEVTTSVRRGADRREEPPAEADDEKQKLRAALAKANKEAAANRHRLKELEDAEEERSRANLSETERQKREKADAEKRAAEAERKATEAARALAEERLRSAVEREATKMGFEYPDIVPSLIDRERVTVDEDTGKPDLKSIKDALERLAKDRPGLLDAAPRGGTPPREGPRRVSTTSGARGQQLSREEEIEAELRRKHNYV